MQQFAELLRSHLAGSVEPSEPQIELLSEHYELLVRWNARLNLTSIRNLEDAVVRHYCESLFFAHHLPEGAAKVLDFGSGAGFPGIPMAILRPELQVTLAESHQRKAVFLRECSRELRNVTVSAKRAEELPSGFDWVVARAVDPASVLKVAPKLARCVGLMIGRADTPDCAGFVLKKEIAIPWGDNRVCIYGCFT